MQINENNTNKTTAHWILGILCLLGVLAATYYVVNINHSVTSESGNKNSTLYSH